MKVAQANGVKDPTELRPGDLVLLPGIQAKTTYQRLLAKQEEERQARLEAERRRQEELRRLAEERRRQEAERQVRLRQAQAPKPQVRRVSYQEGGMRWPLSSFQITTYFGQRGAFQRFHTGIDLAAPYGTPIVAAKAGQVEVAGWSSVGYGFHVILDHGGGVETLYAHMSRIAVRAGQWVEAGQVIGYVAPRAGPRDPISTLRCGWAGWPGTPWPTCLEPPGEAFPVPSALCPRALDPGGRKLEDGGRDGEGNLPHQDGLCEMFKGGVIMDVTTPEQAVIAEEAGAVAVMALERVPADIRAQGGVARMSDPKRIKEIMAAVSIPVMAKVRIGHFVEAMILEAIGVDFIDESEVLTPADEEHHIDKWKFKVPFVNGARDLGEALRRIAEGAAMIRTKGEAGTGNVVEAVRHARTMWKEIRYLQSLREDELMAYAKQMGAPWSSSSGFTSTAACPW